MAVIINLKICDNAEECGGIAVCPTGALQWDDEKKQIVIDNSRCINCKLCEKECKVSAIHVAKDEQEYEKIKKEIDDDPRRREDLLVDRYGAQSIDPSFRLEQGMFNIEDFQSGLTAVELYDKDSTMCLIKSIPIKELLAGVTDSYKKVEIQDKSLLEKLKVTQLPTILFIKEGTLLGKVEGYYENHQQEDLKQEIKELLAGKR